MSPASFEPPWWALGPHGQTLTARLLRPDAASPVTRERVETPVGDFIDVDWSPARSTDAPVVIVLHGLEGSSRRNYVRNLCRELNVRGVRTVAVNFRGCSGEPNRTLSFYHSGDTRDLNLMVDLVRTRHPASAIGAMGFSLGGNVLLKALGEREDGGASLLDAAAVMSVPYDLAAGCRLLQESRMGRLYSEYFMRSLRGKVAWKRERLAEILDLEQVDQARSIWDFDDAVTAPLNGFEDATEYYTKCSSRGFLPSVRVPTLMLHAIDDPFLPSGAIPKAEAAGNRALALRLSQRGGHVGFIRGTPWSPSFWGDGEAARFLFHTLKSTRAT